MKPTKSDTPRYSTYTHSHSSQRYPARPVAPPPSERPMMVPEHPIRNSNNYSQANLKGRPILSEHPMQAVQQRQPEASGPSRGMLRSSLDVLAWQHEARGHATLEARMTAGMVPVQHLQRGRPNTIRQSASAHRHGQAHGRPSYYERSHHLTWQQSSRGGGSPNHPRHQQPVRHFRTAYPEGHHAMTTAAVAMPPSQRLYRSVPCQAIRTDLPAAVSHSDESGGTPTSTQTDNDSPPQQVKRNLIMSPTKPQQESIKRPKGLDKLDMLVEATLEIGPLAENPAGCSCPKSKCIALYCDCFKAGRRCDPSSCNCLSCKNTLNESGPQGARTRAIRTILARNPRAFQQQAKPVPSENGEVGCNCLRSRCLKLYCTCFQVGKVCRDGLCTCVSCLNMDEENHERKMAVQQTLLKRPDAFETKPKRVGEGCACKNNRCVRKYCECFRIGQTCTGKCMCVKCQNQGGAVDIPPSVATHRLEASV